ncbi:helix-turn-helix transcriptional regulator [Pararhizobium haloflavum]|uniref:helix-turn-helix transcriptional regulator n=1 Tax=Pararhizobium haloflavum TaxID=2037914 RepID=UPI00130014E3|nr:LuxR C-terminal-related transcriptional regulator [Pararhizobium haloflavum]
MLEIHNEEILYSDVREIIDDVYDPDRREIDWAAICSKVSERDEDFDVFFYERNRLSRSVDNIISNIDARYLETYKSRYVNANPFLKKLDNSGGVYRATRLLSPVELGRSEFVTEWFLPQGYREAVMSYFGDDAIMQQLFALKLRTDDDKVVRRAQALLTALYPHFRRASTLKARLRLLENERRTFFSETYSFVFGKDCRERGEAVDGWVQSIAYDGATLRFERQDGRGIATMSSDQIAAAARSSIATPLSTENGRIVACFIMPSQMEDGFVVNVIDTESKPMWFSDFFWQRSVSKSEYGVLAAYCLGMSIKNIADIRQRSAETVKRQLKNAMAKIGVTKQEDAVRAFFKLMLKDEQLLASTMSDTGG